MINIVTVTTTTNASHPPVAILASATQLYAFVRLPILVIADRADPAHPHLQQRPATVPASPSMRKPQPEGRRPKITATGRADRGQKLAFGGRNPSKPPVSASALSANAQVCVRVGREAKMSTRSEDQ